jgi:hypothetical protein
LVKKHLGTYAGVVESIKDPEKRGRVKVRVPTIYGPAQGSIPTTDIPWALPAGLPAGGSAASGGVDWPPEVGDQVWVRFIDGEPEKPVWEWAMQNSSQAKEYGYRNYQGDTPNRHALLTRYGQSIELSEAGITAVTSKGYVIQIIDGEESELNGSIEARTGKGYFVQMMDETDQIAVFVKYINASYDELTFMGTISFFQMAQKFEVLAPRTNIKSARVDLGDGADDPIIRRSDLESVCRQIVTWANTHTHPKVPPPSTQLRTRVTFSRVVYAV